MHDIVLIVRRGPLEGKRFDLRLGRVVLGRDPGPEGVTLPRDPEVSRHHGELYENDKGVFYRNLSRHGTIVNRKIVRYGVALKSGDRIRMGNTHLLEVRFHATADRPADSGAEKSAEGGLLSRTSVRLGLATYLLGLLAMAFFLQSQQEPTTLGLFEGARARYLAQYRLQDLTLPEREARLRRAGTLARKLASFERAENWGEARHACRELMAIDSDPASPIYKFGARRLTRLAGRR